MTPTVNLAHVKRLDHKTWMQIAERENALMVELLRSLDDDDWNAPTDCDLWAVRDIVAHLIGWGECVTSFREAGHQTAGMVKRLGEFNGGVVDAQNQVQVDDRRSLTPAELLAGYERASSEMLRMRRLLGVPGRAIPIYFKILGGFSTVGAVADTIFTRDTFMHRIDISCAIDRPMRMGLLQETLVLDIVRDWSQRSGVPIHAELEGPGGGTFTHDAARVKVRCSPVDLCRFMAGRLQPEDIVIDGDPADVQRCIEVRAPF